ncbi:glycosyltransferase [Candidatus Gracilibacteria bacterium]|nr:glycosyltransferase [Candidatus Gracilibacteria bacterium]NJM88990.1 glycosyltransferase [Hydrococcus sp. RU_2_2]NJP20844.1 glycosyltransferase [Hydrococcus sp. CRU_1_1]
MSDQLIIFTRYPEPGKTKTRMIPLLGENEAARLQQHMTEFTLKQAKKLQNNMSLSIAIFYSGGTEQLMRDWLGDGVIYQQQSNGDLGQKMKTAFERSLKIGSNKVIIIGTDCPELNSNILSQAFEMLTDSDLVLGPALDGGYYLIGLNDLIPELFYDIKWGTSKVFEQTKAIAQQLNLKIGCLLALHDIDRPEDLQIWNGIVLAGIE